MTADNLTFSGFPRIPENHYFLDFLINTSRQNDFFRTLFFKKWFLKFFDQIDQKYEAVVMFKNIFLQIFLFSRGCRDIFLKKLMNLGD